MASTRYIIPRSTSYCTLHLTTPSEGPVCVLFISCTCHTLGEKGFKLLLLSVITVHKIQVPIAGMSFRVAFHPRLTDAARGKRADGRGGRNSGGGGSESGGPRQRRRDQTSRSGDEDTSDTITAAANAMSHPNPPVCWHMRGRLTNAATGQTIALVEGVELTRSLAFETTARNRGEIKSGNIEGRNDGAAEEEVVSVSAKATDGATLEDGKELEVDRILKSVAWKAFGTLACSKFFMYQVLGSLHHSVLLFSFSYFYYVLIEVILPSRPRAGGTTRVSLVPFYLDELYSVGSLFDTYISQM